MILRRNFKCVACGHVVCTRTALSNTDYQEFAFPCPHCGLEMRFGMKLLLRKRLERLTTRSPDASFPQHMKSLRGQQHIKYVHLRNARACPDKVSAKDTITLDGDHLIPASSMPPTPFSFSPYMMMLSTLTSLQPAGLFCLYSPPSFITWRIPLMQLRG